MGARYELSSQLGIGLSYPPPVPVFVYFLKMQELIPSLAAQYNPTCYWSFRLHRLIEIISHIRFMPS